MNTNVDRVCATAQLERICQPYRSATANSAFSFVVADGRNTFLTSAGPSNSTTLYLKTFSGADLRCEGSPA